MWYVVELSPHSKRPNPRFGHCMAHYGGKLYLYGGTSALIRDFKDLWSFNLSTSTWVHEMDIPDLSGGLESSGHVLIDNEWYILGGDLNEDCLGTKTFASINLDNLTLKKLGELPFSISSFVPVYYRKTNTIFIYGGCSNDALGDCFEYDINSSVWTKFEKKSPLTSYASALVGDVIFYYGGFPTLNPGRPKSDYNDVLLSYNLRTLEWKSWFPRDQDISQGLWPLPVNFPAMFVLRDRIYLFAGYCDERCLDEKKRPKMFYFDIPKDHKIWNLCQKQRLLDIGILFE